MAELVAVYEYRDESGTLLYASVRFAPKAFRQGRPDGSGGLTWDMRGVRRVPYRLPEVIAAAQAGHVVWIVEGEKDVDRLASLGLTATTNVGGAGKWRAEYATYLHGAHAVVLPDNDVPGRQHADHVARSLVGIAASIKVVMLPDLPEKADVSDWLDAGHDVQALFAVTRATPAWTDAPPQLTEADRVASVLRMIKRLGGLRERAAARRGRRDARAERVADDLEWRCRVAAARAVPITTIAALLGLGRPEGGGKEVRVRCPFHDDEHPSLQLNDEKGLWYCNPCGQGGDAIGLYARLKGVGFADAVLQLTTGR